MTRREQDRELIARALLVLALEGKRLGIPSDERARALALSEMYTASVPEPEPEPVAA
jgi:hypothetical protein